MSDNPRSLAQLTDQELFQYLRASLPEDFSFSEFSQFKAETIFASWSTDPAFWEGSSIDELQALLDKLDPPNTADELANIPGYRILKVLGVGGMGLVFEAEDTTLARRVAIKLIRPTRVSAVAATNRFLIESRLAARLTHDHIVTVYHAGKHNDVLFLVMQLLNGESLAQRLRRVGRLEIIDALTIIRQVSEGLNAAHQAGLLHRDIKPDNIFLEYESDRAKILDFGLAHLVEADTLEQPNPHFGGTPGYIAPEYMTSGKGDARSDLFSLGVVLVQLLIGQKPFSATRTSEYLEEVRTSKWRGLNQGNSAIHPDLIQLVEHLLASDPQNRLQSATELIERIDSIRDKMIVAAPASRHPKARRNWPAWIVFIGTVLLLLFYFSQRNRGALIAPRHEASIAPRRLSAYIEELTQNRVAGAQMELRAVETGVKRGTLAYQWRVFRNGALICEWTEAGPSPYWTFVPETGGKYVAEARISNIHEPVVVGSPFVTGWALKATSQNNLIDEITELRVALDNSLFAAGYISAASGRLIGFDGHPAVSMQGGCDVFICRIDSDGGGLNWVRSVGGGNVDVVDTIIPAPDGGVVVAGRLQRTGNSQTISFSVDKQVTIPAHDPSAIRPDDIFLVKYSQSGAVEWAHSFGGNDQDIVDQLAMLPNGDLYVAGRIKDIGNSPIDFGNSHLLTPKGGMDVFLALYAADGSLRWVQLLGGDLDDSVDGIQVTANGDVCLAGRVQQTDGSPISLGNGKSVGPRGGTDLLIAEYAMDGSGMKWVFSAGGNANDHAHGIRLGHDGDIYIYGQVQDTENSVIDFGNGNSVTPVGGADIFLAKYSADGNGVAWVCSAGGNSDDFIDAIEITPNDEIYVAGRIKDTNRGVVDFGHHRTARLHGENDIFLAKYSSDGRGLIWVRSVGGNADDYVDGLLAAPDGGVYLAGRIEDTQIPSVQFGNNQFARLYGGTDVFLAHYSEGGDVVVLLESGGGPGDDRIDHLIFSKKGEVYLTGQLHGAPGDRVHLEHSGGFILNGGESHPDTNEVTGGDYFVKRIARDDSSWIRVIGGPQNDRIQQIALSETSGLFVASSLKGPSGTLINLGNGRAVSLVGNLDFALTQYKTGDHFSIESVGTGVPVIQDR